MTSLISLFALLPGMPAPSGVLASPAEEISFHYLSPSAPLIMVSAKVNGKGPYQFLLDSGNAGKVILVSPALAADQKIKTRHDDRQGFTVGLNTGFESATLSSFQLGSIRCENVDAAVSPAMTDLTNRLGTTVDGNVGYSFLKDYVVALDFQRKTLRLGKDFPATNSRRIPFEVTTSTPLVQVPVIINGRSFTFALDTGASDCCISKDAAAGLGLTLGPSTDLNHDRSSTSSVSFLKTVKLGDSVQNDVHCVVVDFMAALNAKGGTHIDGILGYNFWGKYRLTIDYLRGAVILDNP